MRRTFAAPLFVAAMAIAIVLGSVEAEQAGIAREFSNANTQIFSTKNHPKANGVNLRIRYPRSWAAEEGDRPNVVQKFTSEGGRGFEVALIIAKELPQEVSIAEVSRALLDPVVVKAGMPPGATYVDFQRTKLEGLPASILEYAIRAERAGMSIPMRFWTVSFVVDRTYMQVQFAVAASEDVLQERMDSFKPLFRLMANSIVLPDKWSRSDGLNDAAPNSVLSNQREQLVATLIISALVTWCIGLTPPLLIRYGFVRHPMRPATATWIAASFAAVFWLSFRILNAERGQEMGSGVVWILVFLVSRWILSRGYSEQTDASNQLPRFEEIHSYADWLNLDVIQREKLETTLTGDERERLRNLKLEHYGLDPATTGRPP